MIKAEDFFYNLPSELIAQTPRRRGCSRLLILPRKHGEPFHGRIRDLSSLLESGDCLVVNDSKVIPARLRAEKIPTGARVELLLHREISPAFWDALARPYRRLKPDMRLRIGPYEIGVAALEGQGRVRVQFPSARTAGTIMRKWGEPPLPPYILRPGNTNWKQDRRRYQTLFAVRPGSVAAPTAGLHFSAAMLKNLESRGVRIVPVTLHVGWGTFAPLPSGELSEHRLHAERYSISETSAAIINRCRRQGGRVLACGTTVARTLESAASGDGRIKPGQGETRLFIRPGYAWKSLDGLLTNFHVSGSSLIMLVCAFGGRERVLEAYAEAIRKKYHFFSYGDAMLLL